VSKVGADDFITATGANAEVLNALPRKVVDSLFRGEPTPLSPAQDFRDGQLFLGWTLHKQIEEPTKAGKRPVRVKEIYLITSCGAIYASQPARGSLVELRRLAEPGPPSVYVLDQGFHTREEGSEWARDYLGGTRAPTLSLLRNLQDLLARRVVFPDRRYPLVIALWVMGTYVFRIFEAYPYLWIRSPAKRCGKTRLLDTLARLAFNARRRITRPTEAFLFRAAERDGGTQLIDETDNLQGDREGWPAVLAVLNHGYTKGGMVPRVNRETGEVQEFDAFCPKAVAGLKGLADTLEDRSLPVILQRKRKGEGERMRWAAFETAARPLRHDLRIWALEHAPALAEIYGAQEPAALLAGLDDRAADLWEPLVSLGLLADGEAQGEGEFTRELLALARELAGIREAAEEEATTPALVSTLRKLVRCSGGRTKFTPKAVLDAVKAEDGLAWVSSHKALAALLQPLGIFSRTVRFEDGRRTRGYILGPDHLADLAARYSSGGEEE